MGDIPPMPNKGANPQPSEKRNEPLGGEPGVAQRRSHRRRQGMVLELDRRQVHGDHQIGGPGGGVRAGATQHEFAERHDQPGVLCDRDELTGEQHAT